MSIIGFPLLLIPLAVCNIIVFLMPGVAFDAPVARLPLPSGTVWPITISDLLVGLGIVFLLLEVLKGARPGGKYVTDHLLSLSVSIAAVVEFVVLPQFGTSTFFLLSTLALADFLTGIALRGRTATARRDVLAATNAEALQPSEQPVPEPAAPEPTPPASALPVAALIAEAVLLDHPIPSMAASASVAHDAAAEIAVPEIAVAGPAPVDGVSAPQASDN
jgi:hypothetical protein